MLCMWYEKLAVDRGLLEVVTIASLVEMKWLDYGADDPIQAYRFYSDWVERVTRINNPLDDEHTMQLLWRQMRFTKHQTLQIPSRV